MSRPGLIAAGVVAVLVMVWAARTTVTGTPDPVATSVAAEHESSGPGAAVLSGVVAAGSVSGIPAGYPATEQGAATAAVNWVASFPALLAMGPLRLNDTLTRLWSTQARSRIEASLEDYLALADTVGGDLSEWVWIESPLQVDVTLNSASSATVQVWSALISGDRVDGPIEVLWRTHHVGLVWERDDWRVVTATVSEGPTPTPVSARLPSPPDEFVTVADWQPAVFADTVTRDAGRG